MNDKLGFGKSSRCSVLLGCLFCCFSLLSASCAEERSVDQKKLMWYDDWVTQYPNDSPPGLSIEDPVELKRVRAEIAKQEEERKARIRTDPAILPYLKALFWMHHRHPDNDGTGGVSSLLEAMTLVPDLSESEVADIAAEVDRLIAEPFQGFSSDKRNYLLQTWMPTLAAHFPTKENADRCVRIIQKSDSFDWYFPKIVGLQVMSKFGTADHLECAEQTWQWLEKQRMPLLKGDFTLRYADEAKLLVEAMKVRIAAASPDTRDTTPPRANSPVIPKKRTHAAVTEIPQQRIPHLHPLWLISGLLLISITVLVLRKKS